MKKLNVKGFTMIEILAMVTLLGILTLIAVPSLSRPLYKSRKTNLDTMFKSTYEAAENYMMDKGNTTSNSTVQVSTLVSDGYLERLVDPADKKSLCHTNSASKVAITVTSTGTGSNKMYDYTFSITLACPASGTQTRTFKTSE